MFFDISIYFLYTKIIMKGFFITFEGIDGCGKTTQAILLYKYLKKKKYNVIHTREPGGTVVAEYLRKLILNPETKILPNTELLLYLSCRSEITAKIIKPAIEKGKIIICERFSDSTSAYQGYARGFNLNFINKLNNFVTEGLKPDLTILLDLDVKNALNKIYRRKKLKDRLDNETVKFHQKVRNGFLKLKEKEPYRIKLVKIEESINKTHQKIVKIVENEFKKYFRTK